MKKVSLCIILFFTSLNFINSQNKVSKKIWTVQQVKEMAKPYNLQDSVSETKNNLLLYMTKSEIVSYFNREVKYREFYKAYTYYREKSKSVRTYSDYFNLLDQVPLIKEDVIKSHGGEDNYAKFKQDALKYQWRIYKDTNQDLRFIRADTKVTPNELKIGTRVDNLPKSRS